MNRAAGGQVRGDLPLRQLSDLGGVEAAMNEAVWASDLEEGLAEARRDLLPDAAGRRHAPRPGTVALRWCARCRRFLGVEFWPRTDRAFVHTHGLCPACFERMTNDALTNPVLSAAEQVGSVGNEPPL